MNKLALIVCLAAAPALAGQTYSCDLNKSCEFEKPCADAEWRFQIERVSQKAALLAFEGGSSYEAQVVQDTVDPVILSVTEYGWELLSISRHGPAMMMIGGAGPNGAFAYTGTCAEID